MDNVKLIAVRRSAYEISKTDVRSRDHVRPNGDLTSTGRAGVPRKAPSLQAHRYGDFRWAAELFKRLRVFNIFIGSKSEQDWDARGMGGFTQAGSLSPFGQQLRKLLFQLRRISVPRLPRVSMAGWCQVPLPHN